MLKLALAAVDRGEVRIREDVPPDHPLWAGAGVELSAPLEVDFTARSVGDGVLVRGRMRTVVRAQCRRCLAEVERPVDDTVDLLFEPLEDEEDDAGGEVYPIPPRGTELDLSGAIREQLLLRVPEYVLCQEECRGLCPTCGADLNAGPCGCPAPEADSPWSALKNVKFDD
jgi:uncharacterized protein